MCVCVGGGGGGGSVCMVVTARSETHDLFHKPQELQL